MKLDWIDYSFSIGRKVDAVKILEYIDENICNEHLRYNDEYWFDYAPEDGPLRNIRFTAPQIGTFDVMQHLAEKFPKAIVIGSGKPYKWSHPYELSDKEIAQVKNMNKAVKAIKKKYKNKK